ncbi:MAG: polysaccharide pyruvyl transferase family protein [Oscillospiraceae bacterium]|nr:polysaccharide pyruvyl transferase family protein [Oscillospiraceae bacterium]
MRKVGIITIFDPANYGNRLQAFALAKTLQGLNCHAVEVYPCNGFASLVKGKLKTNRITRTILEFFWSFHIQEKGGVRNYHRVVLFFDFMKKAQIKQVPSNDSSIDYFVCGSDQIWNPYWRGTPFFFANFAPKEKRIAYAASFGVDTLPADVTANYTMYLKDMAHISVREHAGTILVRDLVQRDVPVVVDPTLLLSRDEWLNMAKKPKFLVKDRFVLTYFLGNYSDDAKQYIEKVSEEHDLQVISLNSMSMNRHWFNTGPAEFLWLIENASLVCTNSFHATVFSIIMNTPFVNFKRDYYAIDMGSRIDTLLQTMQLSDRVYGRVKDECLFDVDFQHVPKILEFEKKRSIEFLKQALNFDSAT